MLVVDEIDCVSTNDVVVEYFVFRFVERCTSSDQNALSQMKNENYDIYLLEYSTARPLVLLPTSLDFVLNVPVTLECSHRSRELRHSYLRTLRTYIQLPVICVSERYRVEVNSGQEITSQQKKLYNKVL
jgi:hypothetical protein